MIATIQKAHPRTALGQTPGKNIYKNIYSVRLKKGMTYLWHIIAVDKHKEPLLTNAALSDNINIDEFGSILASGWGVHIPQNIKQQYDL